LLLLIFILATIGPTTTAPMMSRLKMSEKSMPFRIRQRRPSMRAWGVRCSQER
jgi:hypothetical protein